jgi:hypothetical protein
MVLNADVANACNAGKYSRAKHVPGRVGKAPLEIGDSTSILGAPPLGRLGIEADAKGCRQFSQGLQILAARKRSKKLPHVVVVALGANGPIQDSQIKRALRIVGPGRVLALVTPPRSGSSAAAMRRAARRQPNRILLVDWASYSSRHGGMFSGDGLHPSYHGASVFAKLIKRSIAPFAFPPMKKLRLPLTPTGRKECGRTRQGGRLLRVYVLRGSDRVACSGAKVVAGRTPLKPNKRWQAYDVRAAGRGGWEWAYVKKSDRRIVIAAR